MYTKNQVYPNGYIPHIYTPIHQQKSPNKSHKPESQYHPLQSNITTSPLPFPSQKAFHHTRQTRAIDVSRSRRVDWYVPRSQLHSFSPPFFVRKHFRRLLFECVYYPSRGNRETFHRISREPRGFRFLRARMRTRVKWRGILFDRLCIGTRMVNGLPRLINSSETGEIRTAVDELPIGGRRFWWRLAWRRRKSGAGVVDWRSGDFFFWLGDEAIVVWEIA